MYIELVHQKIWKKQINTKTGPIHTNDLKRGTKNKNHQQTTHVNAFFPVFLEINLNNFISKYAQKWITYSTLREKRNEFLKIISQKTGKN